MLRNKLLHLAKQLTGAARSVSRISTPDRSIKHRWLYNILVFSLLAYFCGSALFTLSKARSESIPAAPVSEPGKAPPKAPTPLRSLDDYMGIVERNLFGGDKIEGEPEPEETLVEEIPLAERSVGLTLVGTVVTDEPAMNVAIIESQRARKQEAYHEGDQVDQIQIKKILRNNIIISMGSEEQRLTMELEDESAAKGSALSSPPSASSRGAAYQRRKARSRRFRPSARSVRSRRSVQGKKPALETSPSETEARAIRLEQQEIEAALADTDKITEEMQLKPYNEGNDSGGLQIGSVKPGSIFAKMGLRVGDVVTGVNGEAFTGVEQAEDLYSSLLEGGNIALEVKRGGRTQKLQVEVE